MQKVLISHLSKEQTNISLTNLHQKKEELFIKPIKPLKKESKIDNQAENNISQEKAEKLSNSLIPVREALAKSSDVYVLEFAYALLNDKSLKAKFTRIKKKKNL